MPTRHEFTATCDRCRKRRRSCAVIFRLVNLIVNSWAREPDTVCLDCRRNLGNGYYKLDPKHDPVRLRCIKLAR